MLARRALLRRLPVATLGIGLPGSAWSGPDGIVQPPHTEPVAFAARALALRDAAVAAGDQGYGAVVVRGGRIVGEAPSRVVTLGDPTAHAEIEAIRDACRRLGSRDLSGAVLYGSSRACPMCESAAYWAGIDRMAYGALGHDAGTPRLY